MKTIKLTQGKTSLVSDADYQRVSEKKWCYLKMKNGGYAATAYYDKDSKVNKRIYLHRFILQAKIGQLCDHINGNKLDNRRSNLRICTSSENQMNRRTPIHNKCGYKGVWFHKRASKWTAQIKTGERKIHLGLFATVEQAALAYDSAERLYFGKYAHTNF